VSDTGPRSVVIEADGGSRGNPGPAAYGAVLKDAETGAVIAEDGSTIGRATNNVAEYSGLIAGLRMAADHAPGADIEVRMDSKLVVEQMSGRWKIKHPDMRPLAMEANGLAPFGTTYTWVPRERNKHADRLANEALDGKRSGVTVAAGTPVEDPPADSLIEEVEEGATKPPARGWGGTGAATTLVLVRHGVTTHTSAKRFSGGLGGDNPPLSDEGRDQVAAAAEWLAPMASSVAAVVASPVRRTRESADIIGGRLGLPVTEEPGFAEMEFGHWDGLTFAEVGSGTATSWPRGSARSTPRRAAASRSAPCRSGCSPGSSGCVRSTPGAPWWSSATSRRSRRWSPTPSVRRSRRSSRWSSRRRR
jgi:ribonuclease HI